MLSLHRPHLKQNKQLPILVQTMTLPLHYDSFDHTAETFSNKQSKDILGKELLKSPSAAK